MDTGPLVSGIGHGALLVWALIGGLFSRAPDDPLEVTEVSIISAQDFAALSAPKPSPDVEEIIPTPTPPEIDETPPEAPQPPVAEMPPPVEETPDVPQPPAQDNPVVLAPPAEIAAPSPSDRVAPTPTETPPPDVEVADETHEETTPDDAAQSEPDPEPATAPEEATDIIITEADEPPSSAPTVSARPSARPKRPTPPVETTQDTTSSTIDDALRNLQAESTAPTGPPLSGGQKDAFLVDVGRCWNVGSLSTAALESKVVVRFELGKDGRPDVGSIHMTGFEGGTESTARQAYETARRAIIRCGVTGYNLPIEKYEQWKIVNITFNPENMRLK